jgi:hypothetical protein
VVIDVLPRAAPAAAAVWTTAVQSVETVTPHRDPDRMTTPDALVPIPATAAWDRHGRQPLRRIRGLRLRELLVLILLRHQAPMTIAALVAAVEACGFGIDGRTGKVVSDQLRYELARGRVRRVGRGVYVAGSVTRQARWRMQRRIAALRADTATTISSTPVVTDTADRPLPGCATHCSQP